MTKTKGENPHGLVAVPDAGAEGVGATVWWNLAASAVVPRKDMEEALTDADLPSEIRPPAVSPETVLRRAAAELSARRTLVRSIKRGVYAVTIEEVDPVAETVRYLPEVAVKLDAVGRPVLTALGAGKVDPAAEAAVLRAYSAALDVLTSDDVSAWLIRRAEALGAVALRTNGGMYFLPAGPNLDQWRSMRAALRAVQPEHRLYSMPTVRASDALEAVADAIASDVADAVKKVSDSVTAGLGLVGLGNRQEDLVGLKAKIARYEGVLGRSLDSLRSSVDEMQAAVAAAKLEQEAAKDEAAQAAKGAA